MCDYMGMTITRVQNYIELSQEQYILTILERFGMENSHSVNTPMDPNIKMVKKTADDSSYDK